MSRSGDWTWVYTDADGSTVPPETAEPPASGSPFGSRSDAESWLGERWPELAAAGCRSAQLLRDAQPVGGPVDLSDPPAVS